MNRYEERVDHRKEKCKDLTQRSEGKEWKMRRERRRVHRETERPATVT